jgi:predicted CopG family antitoxin
MSKTTIPIHTETVTRLKEVGRFGESYDDLVNRLLNERDPPFGVIAE